ncbi:MAG: hypothetical protein KAS90_03855 [Candidatus Aenigmarchaeota archaeon]|nr:hypothetical protein [Candidatus Aenigmarchaeota archaeon]
MSNILLDDLIWLKIINYLYELYIKGNNLIPNEELYAIINKQINDEGVNVKIIKNKVRRKKNEFEQKIVRILTSKDILKRHQGPDNGYSINIDKLFDFRDNLKNKIHQQEQHEIQKTQVELSKKQTKIIGKQTEIMGKQRSISYGMLIVSFFMFVVTSILVYNTVFVQTNISEGLLNVSQTQADILKNQTEISQSQLALLEISTSPYNPELNVWFERGEPSILIKENLLNERNQTEIVEICFKNIGQTSTGHIYAYWDNNWSFNSNNIHIFDLESGKSRCDDLYLVADGCSGIKRDCNEDKEDTVPFGETELRLRITCDFCEPNKEWNETFDVIIR